MNVVTIGRFTVAPADADEMVIRHAALVKAVRAAKPGLRDTQLGRIDESTWIGVWQWDSSADFAAVRAIAPKLPEAAAAFALTTEHHIDEVEVIDEP